MLMPALIRIVLSSFAVFPSAFAVTVDRDDSLREAKVWERPPWIDDDFVFKSVLDVFAGPPVSADDLVLDHARVDCTMTKATSKKKLNGQTMKFYCEVLPGREVKMKYKFDDGEISGELLSTRLLWALGFPVDRMFLIEQLNCRGCTKDPFRDRRVDPESLRYPRVFALAAAESKFPGKSIEIKRKPRETLEGWDFEEFSTLLSRTESKREWQVIERDALKLITVFLKHTDNKPENQRLVCLGRSTPAGGCIGETIAMLQDVGLTFGNGVINDQHVSKANFEDWDTASIWSDPASCTAYLGENYSGSMEQPQINERGRVLLSRLLRGFVNGNEGRRRLKALFEAGRADLRGGTIEQWSQAFLRKVDEIEFPLGTKHLKFRCPLI